MDVSMDTVSVQIETVVNNSSKAIDTLTQKLGHLRKALESVVKASNGLSNISKGINKANSSSRQISNKKSNPSLKSQLSSKGVSISDKDLISKVEGLDKVTSKYKNKLGQVITVQEKMNNGIKDYSVSVKKTFNQTSGLERFRKSMLGIVTQVGLFVGTMKTVTSRMGEYVELSSSYEESLNLFFTEMGSKAEQAYEWVNKFSNALYLDPADVMQYMGAFNSLVSGLGVGADRSYLMSKNLTQLTYDLASYKNLDFETAYEKLMSGISGEIEPLRNTGVALSQATLQELANSLGIEKRISTMNEAEKAELRYIQIIRSSTNWQADLGKTLMSTENIMKTAGQQWVLFKRALGDVATVVVRYLLPYMVALTQILTKVAKSLAKFLGFKIDFAKYKNGGKSVSQGIAQIGEEADKTTKKLNTMLAPFDELNVVQNKSEGTSSGIGSSSGGLGVDLPEYDALSKLTGEWSKEVENAKSKMKSILPIVATVTGAIAGIWGISKIANFVGALSTIAGLFEGIAGVTSGLGLGSVLAPIVVVAGSIALLVYSLVDLYNKNEEFANSFNEKWAGMQQAVQPVIDNLTVLFETLKTTYNETIKPMAEELFAIIQTVAQVLLEILYPVFTEYILPVINQVIEIINDLFGTINDLWKEYGQPISEAVQSAIESVGEVFTNLWENILSPIIDKVMKIVKDLWDNTLSPMFKKLGEVIGELILLLMNLWEKIFKPIIDWLIKVFAPVFENVFNIVSGIVQTAVKFIGGNINSWLDILKGVIKFINGVFKGDWKKAWQGIQDIFKGIFNKLATIVEGVINAIITMINSAIGFVWTGIKKVANGLTGIVEGIADILGYDIDLSIKGSAPKISLVTLPRFEQGGYPDKASLFFANENGIPELVGRIGNQTAVANNDQITTALTSALLTALSGADLGGQGTIVVNIGNKKVYEGMGEHIDSESERYGTSYVNL